MGNLRCTATLDIDQPRLDAEWATLIAIRELIGIAQKGKSTPTYEQSLEFAKAISPSLFDSENTIIGSKEREVVKEYRQRAEAETALDSKSVKPVDIVEREIADFKRMAQTSGERDQLEKILSNLESIRQLLKPRKYSENQLTEIYTRPTESCRVLQKKATRIVIFRSTLIEVFGLDCYILISLSIPLVPISSMRTIGTSIAL